MGVLILISFCYEKKVMGVLILIELVEVNLYSPQTSNLEHASDKALIVVCQLV